MRQALFPTWAIAAVGVCLLGQPTAIAQPLSPLSRFTPPQFQRLSRDLNPSSSEDFFRQGREKFERHVRVLTDHRQRLDDTVLKVTDRQIQEDILREEQRKP